MGDIHGWAPGLINYLVHNQLAEISIDGLDLGLDGKINEENLNTLFASQTITQSITCLMRVYPVDQCLPN